MTADRPQTRPRRELEEEPVEVNAATLDRIQGEPLRAEAAEALAKGETVLLLAGVQEEGARVETIVFAPSGRGAQSTGTWVFRGLWDGGRLLTTKGHALDRDASCFCRSCETAVGLGRDDD
jgi:acetyl-CoA acetyltransferase